MIKFIKKEIIHNQIFWVCPLIKSPIKIDHKSSIERYKNLTKIFNNKVGLIHGGLDNSDKE